VSAPHTAVWLSFVSRVDNKANVKEKEPEAEKEKEKIKKK
jgi:hypothetical protein